VIEAGESEEAVSQCGRPSGLTWLQAPLRWSSDFG